MPSHSTVIYVEPNMSVGYGNKINKDYDDVGWRVDDIYERAPRLEDYCIAMDIEVEVSSRESQISQEGNKEVLIFQWNGKDKQSVKFMSGTRIGGYKMNGLDKENRLTSPLNLTTYYADMYVSDLVDYGTTEMIGVKSVNIEYAKSCVPIITVQFTDVRGLSLFQPTELSRDNTYNGIKGLNKDNVAQSFFQCFFKIPLPKFTISLKGFYGKPVAYVCMCDKFDTNFNSSTGDFDVTARFIGYSYSFMTDISFDALLAAPYSDFEGKKYWDENIKNGRFYLWDKLKTHKMPMPTLYEVHSHLKNLLKSSDSEMKETTLTEEEKTHKEEIESLEEIRKKYRNWYDALFNVLKVKYGKRYCFDFKENIDKDADWYRILILTNNDSVNVLNLSEEYKQYPEEFKKTNDDLYSAIENFNNSGSNYKKLKNVSKDFSEYIRVELFNDCYVNRNTRKIEFGGFNRKNTLNRVQIVNRLFHSNVAVTENIDENNKRDINTEWVKRYGDTIKDYTLSTIYNDGINQYKDAYVIEVDYSDIKTRINALNADANKSTDAKEKAKARKEHNRIMMGKMNWYPSVENFTKIMMAHLETFMMMMYKVAESCGDRKPEDVGITIGKDGNACDVNINSGILPPFPRVVKQEIGEDGIKKTLDTWVGEYENSDSFIEADMINGLFNAVEYIQSLVKEEKEVEQREVGVQETETKPIIKHPLTSYDFHLTKSPYGTSTDISNDPNAFAGKVAMRMFDILSINNFRKQYSSSFSKNNGDFLKKLGIIEAENFYNSVKITNQKLLNMLGVKADNGTIDANAIIQCVKNDLGIGGNNDLPWRTLNTDSGLFDMSFWLSRYSTSYNVSQKSFIYPLQNMSFSNLEESLKIFNKGANSIQTNNQDIIVNWIDGTANAMSLLKSTNTSCFGNIFISDNYKIVGDMLDSSNNSANNCYKDIYDLIYNDSVFDADKFGQMIYGSGVFRPKLGVKTIKKTCTFKLASGTDDLPINRNRETNEMQCNGGEQLSYVFDRTKINNYTSEIENGNITSWFLTECRGFDLNNEKYVRSQNKSLFVQHNYQGDIDKSLWGFGSGADKRVGFFLMGLEAVDYSVVSKYLNSDVTFTYVPKLAALQIGAALASMNGINETVSVDSLSKKVVLPNTFNSIIPYLNRINTLTRIAYIKYFKDWTYKYVSDINKYLLTDKKQPYNSTAIIYEIDSLKRALFREDSEFIGNISNELMTAVLITKGNVNHYKGITRDGLTFDETTADNYLNGFLGRIRELYNLGEKSSGGDAVKLVKSSDKTTDDMKKELYRYLKLIYDKWIPATTIDSWKFETFFLDDKGDKGIGGDGHLFHFIDSFYNKIGDKLLINPMKLSAKIDAALQANDVNTMMLGFMADIYSQNKCMMMCLQNFQDLSNENAMNMMFRPIPFNAMSKPNKHPDFVIVYPYEPSKYLNVDNGEFNNDSFMLNDEFDTPLAVKSRDMDNGECYRIPAFGVSYGKQYQSYFKNVKVGMANPIATQQAIMAKHAILRASQDTATKTTVAQDMYDIYSTQSYTCTVEMMGCAWVQPLMYFVLTNIPMFRGSYLIMKVNHKLTPGNMTTEFTGCRMANVSNKLVEEIFTDEDFDEGTTPYLESGKELMADVDNDCPYKIYPLQDDDGTEISQNEMENAKNAMTILMQTYNYTKAAAAGICGNIFKESNWRLHATNGIGAFGLCQWLGVRKSLLIKKYGNRPSFNQQIDYINYEWNNEDIAKNHKNELNAATATPEDSAYVVRKFFERPGEAEADDQTRKTRARKYFDNFDKTLSTTKVSQPNKSVDKDIYQAFFDAVQKSVNSTNKGCTLKMEMYINKTAFSDGIMMITQEGGNTDKLPLVFDIILNGYYQYVQKLWWVYPTNGLKDNPLHIDVCVVQNPKPNERLVLAAETKKINEAKGMKFGDDSTSVNEKLLKSILKKYKTVPNTEIPQFNNQDIFKDMKIEDCNTIGASSNSTQKPSDIISKDANIMIDGWNVKNAVKWIIDNQLPQWGKGECAKYVELAIQAGGGPLKDKISCRENNAPDSHATNLRYYGILEKHGFIKIYESTINPGNSTSFSLQAGDICIIGHKSHGKYHACMWTGDRWYSDHKQNNMISSKYPKNDAPYPYAIYRFHNKKGTPIT